ncbi:3'-5' exonuclease [Vibrio salinus]|uniref:3'-5' exonuclease n=1 Tax=Vibrio salinus TaxID=2899784 RepID=UPI001E2B1C27|nr:exonuclease domain-containing protein [Vibrio salinus]MCE0493658.1 3'-5' exonuclease [Vibrio salinus]
MWPRCFCSPTTKWFKFRDNYPLADVPDVLDKLMTFSELTPKASLSELDVLVVDFETTGFDPAHDRILSMGWVVIERGIIRLNSARHILIKDAGDTFSEAVKVHQLLPEILDKRGISLSSAFNQLIGAMAGKLILAHGTVMEERFFNQYIEQNYRLSPLPVPWLDTMQIEMARNRILKRAANDKDWRLGPTRSRYGLPQYTAHNALIDAIATAELYLAQMKVLFGNDHYNFEMLYDLSNK